MLALLKTSPRLHCRYGVVVLVVECMGASTMLIYGLCLLYAPVQEDFVADPEHPGRPKVRCWLLTLVMLMTATVRL